MKTIIAAAALVVIFAGPALAAAGHDSLRNTPTSPTGTTPMARPGTYVNGNWVACSCSGSNKTNPNLRFDKRWDGNFTIGQRMEQQAMALRW